MLKKLTKHRPPKAEKSHKAEIKHSEFNKIPGQLKQDTTHSSNVLLQPPSVNVSNNQNEIDVASGEIRKTDSQLTATFKYFSFNATKFGNLTRLPQSKKENSCNKAKKVEKNGPNADQESITTHIMTEQNEMPNTRISNEAQKKIDEINKPDMSGSNKERLKTESKAKKRGVKSSKNTRSSSDQNKFTVKFLKLNVSDRTWLITPDERKTYKTLDLRKAKLSHIPPSVLQLRGFQAVRLSCNEELSSIRELGHMGSLKIVDLKNCGITTFADTGIGLNKLKALELSNNDKIKDFGDLKTLPHLQHLSLAGCLLRTIPAEVFLLTRLQVLVLDNNPLDEGMIDFSFLRELQVLLLANCGLSQIPKSIYVLRGLMYLSIANNIIKSFSEELTDMLSLKVINVFGNSDLMIHHSMRQGSLLKKIQVDEDFKAEKVARKTKRLIEVWKKVPTAWWKHV